MTRFREEHYATRAHKAFTRGKRDSAAAAKADRGTRRTQYFQKPLSVRKAIRAAQATQLRMWENAKTMPRQTRWIDTLIGLNPASGANSAVSLVTGLGPVDTRGVTVIRTMVRLSFSSGTVAGAWGSQQCFVGIGIAAQAAFAIGITALPTPDQLEQPSRGWMYRDFVLATQNGVNHRHAAELRADIRGARKIEDGEVFFVLSNVAHAGTPFTVNCHGLIRMLVKLS